MASDLENSILEREIGKLAGFLGGFGARRAAKLLPAEECESAVQVTAPSERVLGGVLEILKSMGRITEELSNESSPDGIAAVVGSGHLNLNPTIIYVRVRALSETRAEVIIRGVAKEGLVKQHSAAKAVERVQGQLSRRYA